MPDLSDGTSLCIIDLDLHITFLTFETMFRFHHLLDPHKVLPLQSLEKERHATPKNYNELPRVEFELWTPRVASRDGKH